MLKQTIISWLNKQTKCKLASVRLPQFGKCLQQQVNANMKFEGKYEFDSKQQLAFKVNEKYLQLFVLCE